jgi:hypothetical protein
LAVFFRGEDVLADGASAALLAEGLLSVVFTAHEVILSEVARHEVIH